MSAPRSSGRQPDPRRQKLQIARRQLGLTDEDYRALLGRIAGKRSSTGLSGRELDRVLAEMARLGWRARPPAGRSGQSGRGRAWRPESVRPEIRLIFKLWWLLAETGAVARSRPALNAFVCNPKFHAKWGEAVTDVEFLSAMRARDVIEALKDACRRHGAALEPPA